jgi:hypothetical protein
MFAQSHVSQLGLQFTVVTHKNIVGLQIPMDNSHSMEVGQTCDYIPASPFSLLP